MITIYLGWKKLNEYYEILSETPIYYTSLALHPAYRWKLSKRSWTDPLGGLTRRKTWFTMSGVLSIGRLRCLDRSHQPLSQFPSSGRLRTIRFRNNLVETATQRQKQVMIASRQAKTNTCIGLRTAKVVMAPSTILSLTGTRSLDSPYTLKHLQFV
jgi:hypothetical protein